MMSILDDIHNDGLGEDKDGDGTNLSLTEKIGQSLVNIQESFAHNTRLILKQVWKAIRRNLGPCGWEPNSERYFDFPTGFESFVKDMVNYMANNHQQDEFTTTFQNGIAVTVKKRVLGSDEDNDFAYEYGKNSSDTAIASRLFNSPDGLNVNAITGGSDPRVRYLRLFLSIDHSIAEK